VSRTEGVVNRFAPFRETGESAELALAVETVAATGNYLVAICLMADIPDEAVLG